MIVSVSSVLRWVFALFLWGIERNRALKPERNTGHSWLTAAQPNLRIIAEKSDAFSVTSCGFNSGGNDWRAGDTLLTVPQISQLEHDHAVRQTQAFSIRPPSLIVPCKKMALGTIFPPKQQTRQIILGKFVSA